MKNKTFIWSGGALLLLIPVLAQAAVLQGTIEGFKYFSCGSEICFTITSNTAYIGKADGNFAFDEGRIDFMDKSGKINQTLSSNDIYFDLHSRYIYIRNVGNKNEDYVFNLKEQKLSKFIR